MEQHRTLGAILFVVLLLLPALIALFMAWAMWIANKRPTAPGWRILIFRCGLISALLTVALWFPSLSYYSATELPAQGIRLAANWVGSVLWLFGLVAALAGKGPGRIALACWGVFMLLGVVGINLGMLP